MVEVGLGMMVATMVESIDMIMMTWIYDLHPVALHLVLVETGVWMPMV